VNCPYCSTPRQPEWVYCPKCSKRLPVSEQTAPMPAVKIPVSQYAQDTRAGNEQIVYETKLHWIMFWWLIPLYLTAYFIGGGYGQALAGVAFIFTIGYGIKYATSEFTITSMRLIVKVGWISRRTMEMNINKVESVAVDQSILGRIFSYGTITITGTGSTHESFSGIAHPIRMRKAVIDTQSMMSAR